MPTTQSIVATQGQLTMYWESHWWPSKVESTRGVQSYIIYLGTKTMTIEKKFFRLVLKPLRQCCFDVFITCKKAVLGEILDPRSQWQTQGSLCRQTEGKVTGPSLGVSWYIWCWASLWNGLNNRGTHLGHEWWPKLYLLNYPFLHLHGDLHSLVSRKEILASLDQR